jgi:hypothetical protein
MQRTGWPDAHLRDWNDPLSADPLRHELRTRARDPGGRPCRDIAMAIGIVAIGGVALATAFPRDRFRDCSPEQSCWRSKIKLSIQLEGHSGRGISQQYTLLIQEWLKREGLTYPADGWRPAELLHIQWQGLSHHPHLSASFEPAPTDAVHVVARDGQTLNPPARFMADTINIGPEKGSLSGGRLVRVRRISSSRNRTDADEVAVMAGRSSLTTSQTLRSYSASAAHCRACLCQAAFARLEDISTQSRRCNCSGRLFGRSNIEL